MQVIIMMKYDVFIIGAGVAGLTAAYFTTREGFRVAFADLKDEASIGDKVCGDAIGRHHFVELEIEEPVIGVDAMNIYDGVKLVSPDEKHVIEIQGKGYSLNRQKFGYKLYKMALNAGAEAYLKHYFVKPIIEGSWVKGVVIRDEAGRTKLIESKVVVDASGVVGIVRNSLPKNWHISESLPREDYCVTYREIVLGDIHGVDDNYAYIYINPQVAPGGYWWLFPKGDGIYNIGLGVQWGSCCVNPKTNFEKYVKNRFKGSIHKVLHSGGGIVPTRRPIPCMVWNGVVAIGDAAATANPIHGGGIGSAMISAKIASKVMVEALTKNDTSMHSLWHYHILYHKAYGAKQASLDILRIFIQHLSNEDFNFIFKSNLIDGRDVYGIGYKGELSETIISRLRMLLPLVFKPTLLAKLYKVKQYMEKAYQLYLTYPRAPTEYPQWKEHEERLFNEFREWLRHG